MSEQPSDPPGAADQAQEELVAAAREVLRNAHAPYSGLRVGAALRARDGRVFRGCNVESASYGLTICAERSALVQAVAAGAREFDAVVVAVERDEPLAPCGACRQLLYEFAPDLRVTCAGGGGAPHLGYVLTELLPHAFGPGDLAGGERA